MTIQRASAATLAVLVAVFLFGPRVEVDTTIRHVSLPADLDAHLTASEAPMTNIVPGTEKTIVWSGEPGDGARPLSLVYLHGFSATRQETAPLTERLGERLDAHAFLTRLYGHGRTGENLATASVNAWLNDAAEAMAIGRRLGERVVLVGTSTGATLATWVAAQERWKHDLAALVLISPNFRPADPGARVLAWPWGLQIARLAVGDTRTWEPYNEGQARYWTHEYPVEALMPMAGLVALVRDVDLSTLTTPTLVIYSSEDEVISVPAVRHALGSLGGAPLEALELGEVGDPSNHVLAGDILSPEQTSVLEDAIVGFLEAVAR